MKQVLSSIVASVEKLHASMSVQPRQNSASFSHPPQMLNPTHEPSSTVAVESKLHASGSEQPTQNNASFSHPPQMLNPRHDPLSSSALGQSYMPLDPCTPNHLNSQIHLVNTSLLQCEKQQ